MKLRFVFLFWIAFSVSFNVFGQPHSTDHEDDNAGHPGMKAGHRLTLGLGHTSISKGEVQGKTQWLATASWSLNYDYRLTDKWAVGLQNDIILESFLIEDHFEEIIEKSYPVSIIPVAIYNPGKHLSLIGGVGAEFASGHTLALTRLGLEYGFHLPKKLGGWGRVGLG